MGTGRILLLRRDGSRRQIEAPSPVQHIRIEGDDVVVVFAEVPVSRPEEYGAWSISYPRSIRRIAKQALLDHGVDGAGTTPVAEGAMSAPDHQTGFSWLDTDPDLVRRYGVRAGGLIWWAGAPSDGDRINRRVVLVGHDPDDGRERRRLDLGLGLVGEVRAVGAELWLIVTRQRFLAVPRDAGVDVLAVAASGTVRTIHVANTIDVSSTAPPLADLAVDEIAEHIDRVRQQFDRLDAFWRDQDGNDRPLSDGLTDPGVDVDGDWPDVRLLITLRHTRRPGLRLRRTLPLFDESGLPIEHTDAAVHLMEDLDTGYLAPASEAMDGVLDT